MKKPRLAKLMRDEEWTDVQMAAATSTSVPSVIGWRQGLHSPSAENERAIVKALNTRLNGKVLRTEDVDFSKVAK